MTATLIAAATAAAILSATMITTAGENSPSQNGVQSATAIRGHRAADPAPQEQASPIALKTTPIGMETGMGARRRAAIAALFLMGATTRCPRAESAVLLASGGC